MLNNSILKTNNLEMLSPLFSTTVEASGMILTEYIEEILNTLLNLSVLQLPHAENAVTVIFITIFYD